MEKLKRTILFWTLVVLFCLTAPTVILNAKGYRFDWKRGIFVHSGTISIKSNPQSPNIALDGELQTSTLLNRINQSINLSGLIPRDYNITVSASGFQTWNKKIDVHSGLSSEFWNVLLVRDDYERTAYSTGGTDRFFISPKTQFIALNQYSDNGLSVKVVELSGKSLVHSFSFPDWNFIDENRQENIEWAPQENYLSIPVMKNTWDKLHRVSTIYDYFIVNLETEKTELLSEILGKDSLRDVRWDPSNRNFFFAIVDDQLLRIDISHPESQTVIGANVSAFELSKTAVYYVQKDNNLVIKTSLDGSGERNQITYDSPFDIDASIKKLIVYDDDRMVFLTDRGDLFVYNNGLKDRYFRKLGGQVSGMQFSDDGKKLLWWTQNEMAVYFLRDWNVQPTRQEDEIQTITRYADPIRNVQWAKDYEHAIFSVNGQIKIIELDPRDHRNIMDITSTQLEKPCAVYDHYLEKLFFTDKSEDSNDLFEISFPESINLLGF